MFYALLEYVKKRKRGKQRMKSVALYDILNAKDPSTRRFRIIYLGEKRNAATVFFILMLYIFINELYKII